MVVPGFTRYVTATFRHPLPLEDVELVGGHPVLDLVNTVSWRTVPERRVDRLASARELAVLARRTGIVPAAWSSTASDPSDDGAALAAAVELRESLHAWLAACARREPVDAVARRKVAALVRRALDEAIPADGERLGWTIDVGEIGQVPSAFALSGASLLQSDDLAAVSECKRAGCGSLFLDRSRNHSRRWCSSSDCGNVVRARRHYARQRSSAGGG